MKKIKRILIEVISFIHAKGKKSYCANCAQDYCHCWLTGGACFAKKSDNRIMDEVEYCPHCLINEVEVDDFGYYGCRKCMPELSADAKARQLDQDGTGQDWEVYG